MLMEVTSINDTKSWPCRNTSSYVSYEIRGLWHLGCTPTWTSQANTNVFNGQSYAAATLAACQAACFNNVSCTGIDWDPGNPDGQHCWFSGPWSGRWNINGALGVTHYNLTRNCTGKMSLYSIKLFIIITGHLTTYC